MSDYEPNMQQIDNSDTFLRMDNDQINKTKTKIPFWSENPNIILQSNYLLEFFPTETMTYEQKLNAISRLVLLITLIGFIITKNIRIIVISVITLLKDRRPVYLSKKPNLLLIQ